MKKIEISTKIIWQTVFILLFLWILFLIRDIILLLLLSIIVVSAAQPFVDRSEKKKIPRVASALGLFTFFFFVLGLVFYLIIPIIINELKEFAESFPLYFNNINTFFKGISQIAVDYHFEENFQYLVNNTVNGIANSLSGIFSNSLQFITGIFKLVIIVSLSFYMLVKKNGTRGFLQQIVPKKHLDHTIELVLRIQAKIGRWLIGQITLIAIVFSLDFLALSVLGVPFALIIALIGGLLEIIPFIGPTIAIIPAVLAALTISPLTALFVFLAYIVIQLFENYVLVPLIMRTAVGLNPVVIILSLLIGGTLAGASGVIIAVPFATAASLLIGDAINKETVVKPIPTKS
ncbi:MAG: AI-2E family transporter [Patescibacteria group bacterium]|nr:AI-2E family transporter [Patescibacteria group bacterium]